ncbi:gamma-tubulin complex component 2 isoform X1 [Tribolium castaneum]|uniref:gamma-tubulin complex component 2 isoform X1 n=1 Tax=Tribolium castaneum TaxID=7070 RepID=UPI00017580E6|nr:PREDICTED: gamma-tubulin complex component 2 isoform X1 [Tribolium castaneum]|eukprot:XP_015834942.1 PREDICTED: gamma-tubulin complex component 2 isoform X1 [Tribolium castaneum]
MSEFKLQHLVAELLNCLGAKNPPEKLVEALQKSISSSTGKECSGSQVAIQSYVQRIAEDLKNSEPFLLKFEDLKQKNVDCLGPYVQLLYHISQDSSVRSLLGKMDKHSEQKTEITRDDLPQVRNRLRREALKRSQKECSSSSILNTSTNLPRASTPSVTSWVQRRPTLSCDFSTQSCSTICPAVPVVSQENILIKDLLVVLIGIPGCYIEAEELNDPYAPRTFKINDNVPLPLQELVKQILPIASHYSLIQRFAEEKLRFEFGQVNNALAEEMSAILKEHLIYVTQLQDEFEADNLNLQKLWFYVQKRLQPFGITANIATKISKSDAKGGKVLSLLHDHIIGSIGDERTQQRCVSLMEAACVPYMKMLGMWIYRGIISDPISEFLVKDNEVIQKEDMPVDYSADYWDKKYSIEREKIPKFLEPVSDIILKAGKYLNVIRQCGKPVKNKIRPILYKIEEKHYIEAIENAYKFASQTLLELVVKEKDLLGRLRSVKHYFLLDQGDFIVTFLTLCEKELSKDVGDVIQGRIESLMDLALRLSSAVSDPYKDDLRTELLPYDLQFQMMKILTIQTNMEQDFRTAYERQKLLVIDSFSFSYEVHWPLSLILNRKSLACYQMIFRHLFYCKYVERMICQVWKCNKVAKKFHFDDAQHYRAAFALRQRMLHCVQNLEYHMMVEVIEPHWCLFLQKISKVNNVDEILFCHRDFLDSCLKDCMLTIPPILRTVTKLLAICVDFCQFMQRTQKYFVEAELGSLPSSMYESFHQNEKAFQDSASHASTAPSFKERISLFDVQFSVALVNLLDQINNLNKDSSEHDRLFNLLYRLDFNSFYSGDLMKKDFGTITIESSG